MIVDMWNVFSWSDFEIHSLSYAAHVRIPEIPFRGNPSSYQAGIGPADSAEREVSAPRLAKTDSGTCSCHVLVSQFLEKVKAGLSVPFPSSRVYIYECM